MYIGLSCSHDALQKWPQRGIRAPILSTQGNVRRDDDAFTQCPDCHQAVVPMTSNAPPKAQRRYHPADQACRNQHILDWFHSAALRQSLKQECCEPLRRIFARHILRPTHQGGPTTTLKSQNSTHMQTCANPAWNLQHRPSTVTRRNRPHAALCIELDACSDSS
jgi:hypothetical protein